MGGSLDAANAFGKVLRRLRTEAGFTQESLGFEADLRRTYISILELGQQQPSLTTLVKIAVALRLRPHELVRQIELEMDEDNRR